MKCLNLLKVIKGLFKISKINKKYCYGTKKCPYFQWKNNFLNK